MPILSRIRIATGASANHGNSLVQLLTSLKRWERRAPVSVYDLGLLPKHIAAVEALGFSLLRFPFEDYPPHLNIDIEAGHYAWKPAIVQIELPKADVPLVWLDAGDLVVFPLMRIRRHLRKIGFYSNGSKGTMAEWTHSSMYEALNIPVGWAGDKRPLNGACIAFDPKVPASLALADAWFAGAMDKRVIAPEGSDRTNHRQDQALLSLLAYRSGIIARPCRSDRSVRIHQDLPE